MKHASAKSLEGVESLLKEIRASAALNEKKRGIFYLGAKAFLHFHENPSGMYADLKGLRFPPFWRRDESGAENIASRVAAASVKGFTPFP
jgi:hypothetical protein